MRRIEVRMAKATKEDTQRAIDFMSACGSVLEEGVYPKGHKLDGQTIREDGEIIDYLARLFESVQPALSRVIYGYSVLASPENDLIDNDADTLELSPRIQNALKSAGLCPKCQLPVTMVP